MTTSSSTQELLKQLQLFNDGYQEGYDEAIKDLKLDIVEDKEEIKRFSKEYVMNVTEDEEIREILESHFHIYSYLILAKYITK